MEDALSELDFSALGVGDDSAPRRQELKVEEIAQVYARALFEVAIEHDSLDEIHEQLDAFADAMNENRQLAVFFFSPYFSVEEKKDGLARAVTDANPAFANFLQALIERHRMPAIFRIRAEFDDLWDEARSCCRCRSPAPSSWTLRPSRVWASGSASRSTARSRCPPTSIPTSSAASCCRVGNVILDASIKNRLEQLRKQVAQA